MDDYFDNNLFILFIKFYFGYNCKTLKENLEY